MSTHPANALSPQMMATAPARQGRQLSIAGLSINGALLFAASSLVVASGFSSLRPEVMGLMLHPSLVPVGLAFPFILMSRISEFPTRVLSALVLFVAMYCFSVCNGTNIAIGEIFKIVAGAITIITCALLVRRRGDFVAGALGLSLAIALLAWHGLQEPAKGGVEAMQGANKNSYSLFALPAMLIAGFIYLRMPIVPSVVRNMFVVCTLPALLAIFMSANRSGYLGAALIGLMLFWDRRGKGLLLVGILAASVAFLMVHFKATEVFDRRMKQTIGKNESDDYRRDIVFACLRIGLENPIIGVSPQLLQFEIGRRTSIIHHYGLVDSHNVFAHIWAGSGLICFAALMGVGWTLLTWRPRDGSNIGGADDPLRDARKLLRMMVVLWIVRGFFTREILYNPAFNIAMGLTIGFCLLAERAREQTKLAAPRRPAMPGGMRPALGG